MSTEIEHTPGPLYIEDTGCYGYQIRDERNRWIGTANNDHGLPKRFASNGEARPNALLWAAAPEMKDALIQLQAAVDDLSRKLPRDPEFCADYIPQWDALEAAGLAAEAALAKAKEG